MTRLAVAVLTAAVIALSALLVLAPSPATPAAKPVLPPSCRAALADGDELAGDVVTASTDRVVAPHVFRLVVARYSADAVACAAVSNG
jgi:hypothetical protein